MLNFVIIYFDLLHIQAHVFLYIFNVVGIIYDYIYAQMFTCILFVFSCITPANTKYLHNIYIFDVGPTLYKCYTNVLCLLGHTM